MKILEIERVDKLDTYEYQIKREEGKKIEGAGVCNFFVVLGATENPSGVVDVSEVIGGCISVNIAVPLLCSMVEIIVRIIESLEEAMPFDEFNDFMNILNFQLNKIEMERRETDEVQ